MIYVYYGPKFVWASIISVIALNTSLWLIYYKRMVPLRIPEDYATLNQLSTKDESKLKFSENRLSG
jgi:hypothetical protein